MSGRLWGNYESQRDDAVDLIIKKYREEFAKNPMITSDYLSKNKILDRIVNEVTDRTKKYLQSQFKGSFEHDIQNGASKMTKEFVGDIYINL